MGIFLFLLILAIIFFGLGFAIHLLWIAAVVAFLLWLISVFVHHA